MEEHTFPLPEQQACALDELKYRIVHRRGHYLLAIPWVLLALGLAAAALIANRTRVPH